MNSFLSCGIPSEKSYQEVINSDNFKSLEVYSNNFLKINNNIFIDYSKKWVKDPLHQWSRQWEYSFVSNRIENINLNDQKINILDAGSGLTFFPFYISNKYENTKMYCIDYDSSLTSLYNILNKKLEKKVKFVCSPLQKTNFENDKFDILYSISVLEHTDNYSEIIDEFYRILRPGGKLIITFDLSIDGTKDISFENGDKLLNLLNKRFEPDENLLNRIQFNNDSFSTKTAKRINKNLLPWKKPSIFDKMKKLIQGKKIENWPPNLTFYAISLNKPQK